MTKPSTFQVYNASAGSGKTFTLVKEYLKVLLLSEDIFAFQNILAITFTNKAAGEMKTRVLQNLEDFASERDNQLLNLILQETTIDRNLIKDRSQKILEAILNNYSAFSITTIDSFTHKIIKNFAFDLGLTLNFEVEMDAVSLLNEAVDVLISKIGIDKKLTKALIDYSLDKTDDDKSWDISNDLNDFAKILLNEDDISHFRNLIDKELDDFFNLKNKLQKVNKHIELEFEKLADVVLNFIADNQLSHNDFSYGDYPKHFLKFKNLRFLKNGDINFTGRLSKNIEENKNLHGGKASVFVKESLETLKEQFHQYYYQSKELFDNYYTSYILNRIALKSIVPLAVLNHINGELETIKEENNIRLNSEFNQLISDNIKEQPSTYIYERIGQRFQNYFIDEMQDTSTLQWQNLVPLIDNALAQENSNLLLVGDGKQAIYRWRGGKAEQFIGLGAENENPFLPKKEIKNLETNYRSYSEIINFNNSFFQHSANFIQNESYKKLFINGNKQEESSKKGGYVSISFLEDDKDKEEKKLRYPKKVLSQILDLKNQFSLGEICVITRTKKDGIAIASYLSENNIPIVSSETLLIKNSGKVNFIINFLKAIQNANDEEICFEILYFLYNHLHIASPKHQFLKKYAKTSIIKIVEDLNLNKTNFNFSRFQEVPLYEKIEELIRGFQLVTSSDAYIQFFLDVVLEQQRKGDDIVDFINFWELKNEKLSVVAQEQTDAVQIMTIHKSKGLEFPVVIFPCDVEIYRQINPKVWINNLPDIFDGFDELLMTYSKDISLVSERGVEIYNQKREELELDNFNLLYVALTRAIEQLYIITNYKISKKGEENLNYYSGVFINFLKDKNSWRNDSLEYCFGNKNRLGKPKKVESTAKTQEYFISNPWQEQNIILLANSSKLWNTEKGKAIDYGNLLHQIFEKIVTKNDVEKAVDYFHNQGLIDNKILTTVQNLVKRVVHHPKLKQYYLEDVIVFNEREIKDVGNQVIIPDRLVFIDENKVDIIDYKTGSQSKEHHQQLLKYEKALTSMGINVDKKLLIYLNDCINIVEV